MMIICLAGINTVDLFCLKKKNYHDGLICYERRKTRNARSDNAYFEIRVPSILQPTIDKYLDKTDSEYLFNFHKRLSSYDSFNANVNIGIRQICEKILNIPHESAYSAYTFRHTWYCCSKRVWRNTGRSGFWTKSCTQNKACSYLRQN